MEYNSGRNRASNFNFRFEITRLITPELYDTKSYYQLIVPITKCKNLSCQSLKKKCLNKLVTGPVILLVASIILFQLKLDSLPRHNFFIDFDWLSCAR